MRWLLWQLLLLEEVIRYVRVFLSCPERDFERFIFEVTGVSDTLDLDGRVLCDLVVKLFWDGVCLISATRK